MSSKYELIQCPHCGDSRYEETNGVYECKTCSNHFFRVTDEETDKLYAAQTELELNNFKKADSIYQNILKKTDNEKTKVMCYFGRLLAYFGIKYVKDFNGNLIITISNYDPEYSSIKESTYYKPIENSMYKVLYDEQLDKLDNEYKRVKTELNKGNKYDVFICTKISLKTKENPNVNGYTEDYRTANTLYNNLTQRGLNVFYSETLSGISYDSQIYSALIKSKSIIVISSKKEYLESPWVQSEWQRWINFIKKEIKEKDSLYLFIPQGSHYEVPEDLQKTQRFSDTLEMTDIILKNLKKDNKSKTLDVVKEIQKAENYLLLEKITKAKEIYEEIIENNPEDYRPWLGLIKILEEEGTESTDKRYKNYLNRALNLCNDNQEKENIKNKYQKYLEEKKQVDKIEKHKKESNTTEIKEELEFELSKNQICPICGDSRYEERNGVYVCNTCDTPFFRVTEEETHKLQEAQTALEIYNFTKADSIYQNILRETDNEETKVMCYFGRLLAYFGIVYVKDFNKNLVVTITNYDPEYASIKESTYYKQIEASRYKDLYIEKIEKLDKEYRGIEIELNSGNKYDVFICTKISLKTKDQPDLYGCTEDSKYADRLYDELTKKGLSVFYSDRILSGIDYDAQIYSALMRSKKIIIISSRKEYLESAWVESEWQRWINFIKKEIKEKESLYLYIPNGQHYELPTQLQRTQKFNDTLELVNRVTSSFKTEEK